jgi:hypothetical protein
MWTSTFILRFKIRKHLPIILNTSLFLIAVSGNFCLGLWVYGFATCALSISKSFLCGSRLLLLLRLIFWCPSSNSDRFISFFLLVSAEQGSHQAAAYAFGSAFLFAAVLDYLNAACGMTAESGMGSWRHR